LPQPFLNIEHDVAWTNKHQNVTGRVRSFYDAWNLWADQSSDPVPWRPGMAGLQRAVRDAEAAGASIRALGGSWSLSDVAYCPDFMVNTKPLNARDIGIHAQNLVASAAGLGDRLVFAQCGNAVQELNDALAARSLALPTSGASDGQTYAGAVSTGTHGAANQVGGMQDSVVGIHLIGERGEPFWIEPASRPIVSDRFLGFVDTPPANLRRDDDLFHAALVSMGSFGILHGLMFAAEPLYSLESHLRRYDLSAVRSALETLDVGSLGLPRGNELPFHFEVVLNAYRPGNGEQGAYVRFMYKRPGGSPPPAPGSAGGHRPGDDLLGVIGTLSDKVPGLIPKLVTALMNGNLPTSNGVVATPAYTFGPTTIRGRGTSTEMGFALQHVNRAVDVILGVADAHPFGAVVALRFVKPSRALLAFTRYAPTTCTIEIQGVDSERTAEAYRRIWSGLDQAGIPFTLHWGQALPPEPARYQAAYGQSLVRWKAARDTLLSPAGRRLFSNPMLRAAGLT
jgi:hypothetical protein